MTQQLSKGDRMALKTSTAQIQLITSMETDHIYVSYHTTPQQITHN